MADKTTASTPEDDVGGSADFGGGMSSSEGSGVGRRRTRLQRWSCSWRSLTRWWHDQC